MAILDEVLQTLEIQPTGIPTVVRLSQNENGRQIRLTLRGHETDFPAGCLVTISGTKPDGVVYSASGSLDGNVAVINEDTQMTAVAGMWKARVNVTYGGSTIATELIVIEVYADPVDPGSVPSESELNGLVAEAQYWAENARSSAYGSPLVAETAADMIETDRVYVYTGSETGYTAGHWYYYDAGWQDGGIYQSGGITTDTTLSVPGAAADAKAAGDAIAEKADPDGAYPYMYAGTAGAVLSDSYTEDSAPYTFRRTPYKSRRLMDEIVGGSVVWNQFCNGASVSVPNGHKYLSKIADAWTIGASTGAAITGLTAGADMVIDLTQMFGSTIADYIYNLEQTTAGAGVALFRSLFSASYYPYNAGELVSISGLSAHVMRDADNNVIGNYALDSALTLRGIPKLDSNNKLYFDGDRYASDGTVTRRYGVVDLGTLNWIYTASGSPYFRAAVSNGAAPISGGRDTVLCERYSSVYSGGSMSGWTEDKSVWFSASNISIVCNIAIKDSSYTDAASFKASLSGVYLLYELATPTTETAEPYQAIQVCDPDGTEEYVTTGVVPVGHNTRYYRDIDAVIPAAPAVDGTYTLKCTVTDGVPSYSWEV